METKIDNALDIQNTLSDLVRQQKLAADKQDQQQLESVQGVIQDIKGHKSFLSVDATSGKVVPLIVDTFFLNVYLNIFISSSKNGPGIPSQQFVYPDVANLGHLVR